MSFFDLGDKKEDESPTYSGKAVQAYDAWDLMSAEQNFTEKAVISSAERRGFENLLNDRSRRYEKLVGRTVDDDIESDPEFSIEAQKLRAEGVMGKPILLGTRDERVVDLYNRFIDKKVKEDPDFYKSVGIKTKEQIQEEVYQGARNAKNYVEEVRAGAPDSWASFFLGTVGSAKGQLKDPINIKTIPVGLAAKTILGAVASGAAENAGVEMIQQFLTSDFQERAGIEMTPEERVSQVVGAGAGGGAFSGGAKAVGKVVGKILGKSADDQFMPPPKESPAEAPKTGPSVIRPEETPAAPKSNKIEGLEDAEGLDALGEAARKQGEYDIAATFDKAAAETKAEAFDLSRYADDIDPEIHARALKEIDDAINDGRPIRAENIALSVEDLNKVRLDTNNPRLRTVDARMRAHLEKIKRFVSLVEEERAAQSLVYEGSPPPARVESELARPEPEFGPRDYRSFEEEVFPRPRSPETVEEVNARSVKLQDTSGFDNEFAEYKSRLDEIEDFSFFDDDGKVITKSQVLSSFATEKQRLDAITLCGARS